MRAIISAKLVVDVLRPILWMDFKYKNGTLSFKVCTVVMLMHWQSRSVLAEMAIRKLSEEALEEEQEESSLIKDLKRNARLALGDQKCPSRPIPFMFMCV